MPDLKPGVVAALFTAQAKATTSEAWERDVAGVWDRAVDLLGQNRGFKGIVTLWNNDDSREVCIIGLWEDLETRLAYESGNASDVRDLFNGIFQAVPHRPRFVVTRSYDHA